MRDLLKDTRRFSFITGKGGLGKDLPSLGEGSCVRPESGKTAPSS